jgi:thiamine pyrophosphokinase
VKHINVLIREDGTGFPDERRDESWAGVDRGVYLLLKEGIVPDFTYGDFDSVDASEWAFINRHMEVAPVPSRKDDTDLEMCLKDLVERGYQSIDVYGAIGGRLDHTLGNIFLLMHGAFDGIDITLIDAQNVMRRLDAGTHEVEKVETMRYASFIPFVEGTSLTLEGFEYNLEKERLKLGATLTISNEFLGATATVHTDEPIIMIQSRDE